LQLLVPFKLQWGEEWIIWFAGKLILQYLQYMLWLMKYVNLIN